MAIIIHLHQVEKKPLLLKGELPAVELDLDKADELIHPNQPLRYELEVAKTGDGLLLRGDLHVVLDCECARCLGSFQFSLDLTNWVCLLPWKGEERVTVVNDCVDLTPYLREDIVLAFPQQPLCRRDCKGLNGLQADWQRRAGRDDKPEPPSTLWGELDKLEF